MTDFDFVYVLENPVIYIVEIKYQDHPENALPSLQYQWLRINKHDLAVSFLHFEMMDSSDKVEERYFSEGFLKFNEHEGTYIEKFNKAQHMLHVCPSTAHELNHLKQAIGDFLTLNTSFAFDN